MTIWCSRLFPFVLAEQINLVGFSLSRVYKIPAPDTIISKNKIINDLRYTCCMHAWSIPSCICQLLMTFRSSKFSTQVCKTNMTIYIYIYDLQDSTLSHYSTATIQNVSLGTCFFIAENVNYTLLYHIYYIYACRQACHLQAPWSVSSQSGEIENQLPYISVC